MIEAVAANDYRLRGVYLLDDLARHLHAAVQYDIRALAGLDDLALRLNDTDLKLVVQPFKAVLDKRRIRRASSNVCYLVFCQFGSSLT